MTLNEFLTIAPGALITTKDRKTLFSILNMHVGPEDGLFGVVTIEMIVENSLNGITGKKYLSRKNKKYEEYDIYYDLVKHDE